MGYAPVIEVKGLKKSFGDVTAVKDVSFTARDGEVTGLLGPNGAGKSTTLRVLYGLMQADAGTALIDGFSVEDNRLETQSRIGVLPDTLGLYPRLTAIEHIHYFGRLQGLSERQLATNTAGLIDTLDMQGIAHRRTEGFSQGERMKVCLARALVHDPGNILLDEPTNGLDVMTTRSVREMIKRLKSEQKTVLFSSHQMHEVSSLCDKIVIVAAGCVVAQGSPDEIRHQSGCENLEDAFVKLAEGLSR